MYKIIALFLLSIFLLSCFEKNENGLALYQAIKDNEAEIKKFDGHSISYRGVFYVFDLDKAVYFVDDFTINKEHQIKLVNSPKISKDKENEIYLLLEFVVKHKIVSAKSFDTAIEFRTRNGEISVYFKDLQYMDKVKTWQKSFQKINQKWGYYSGDTLS